MIKRRSAKNKGYKLQKEVASDIRELFGLGEREVVSTPSSVGGVDILLSKKALNVFPYSVECKNQERLNIWKALKQSETNVVDNTKPILVFKRNRSDKYVVLKWEHFLDLIGDKNV